MDLMARGNVIIDTVSRTIRTGSSRAKTDYVLLTQKAQVWGRVGEDHGREDFLDADVQLHRKNVLRVHGLLHHRR